MEQGTASAVPETATQETETLGREWRWVEASIWTARMVSALVNGVKGNKWFSLIDKLVRPTTLEAAWHKVARNKGASGVDGQSIERFAAQAERYLQELHDELKTVNRRRKVGRDRRRKVGHTGGCNWRVVHRVHRGDPPPLRSALALARSGGGGEFLWTPVVNRLGGCQSAP